MKVKLFILGISILFSLPLHGGVSAQTDHELNEALEGFDDQKKSGEALQETLDGFDDDAPAAIESEPSDEDHILEGFEDQGQETQTAAEKENGLPEFLSIDGYIKLSSVYALQAHEAAGTDTSWHGLTRLRPEIKLIVDADLWQD